MKRRAMKKVFTKMMMVLSVISLYACGGGGGSSSPVGPSYTASFAQDVAGAQGVSLAQKSSGGSIVYVDVVASNVTKLFGADIKLSINGAQVTLGGSCTAGTLLPGAVVFCEQNGDEIVIGISLQSPASPVSGSGVIATVPLKVTAPGMSAVSFALSSKLYDDAAPTPAEVTINSWTGGTISGI